MNNIGEKYLPIGTVVILKNAKKKVMVIGFVASGKETKGRTYDYAGCLYPEGMLSAEQTLLFDHEQIDKVYHMGYVDEDEQAFKTKLKGYLASKGKAEEVEEL